MNDTFIMQMIRNGGICIVNDKQLKKDYQENGDMQFDLQAD